MNVDGVGTIVARHGDVPAELAAAFVAKHALDAFCVAPIEQAIEQQMQLSLQKRGLLSSS